MRAMKLKIDTSAYRVTGKKKFRLAPAPTLAEGVYKGKDHYKKRLAEFQEEIDELQSKMYAHDRYGLVIIFQAMDAAGKDGTIQHVMSGVNPHGITVTAFKQPSAEELDHDFLWRTNRHLPERGRIAIFNRSYYEEVLIVRVHPKILTDAQRLPDEIKAEPEKVWEQRFESIREMEKHLVRNGVHVLKFFLNVSKDEQAKRFLDRLDTPEKNWKFSEGDVAERAFWADYMKAYEDAINATSTEECPWHVIPADDKRAMRLIVSRIILDKLASFDMAYPAVSAARRVELEKFRAELSK